MGDLCNAVLVIGQSQLVWVGDAASIATWGRIEGSISAGEISDIATLERIGAEYVAARAQPVVAHVVEIASNGPKLGTDIQLGDTLTAGSDSDLRVVGATWALDSDGELRGVPELETPLEALPDAADRKVRAIIDAYGGLAGASAPPVDRGTNIPAGKLRTSKMASWGWATAADLDNAYDPTVEEGDGGMWGEPHEVEEPARLYEWVVNCRTHDDDGLQLTFGTSRFELYIDDAPIDPPFVIEVGELETRVAQQIYGPSLVVKGQKVRPVNLDNGGHEQGSVEVWATEPT